MCDFHCRLKELVDSLDIKKKTDISKNMGITFNTFSKIYNYGIVPKTVTVCRIADYFNVSVTYLLALTDDKYFDKSKNPKTFLERIEELRNGENLTYYGLSKIVPVDKSVVNGWRKKNHIPTLEILENLADHFNVSLDYLLGRTDDDTPYK